MPLAGPLRVPILLNTICSVCTLGSQAEMMRIHTEGVVASVHHKHPPRDISIVQPITVAVCSIPTELWVPTALTGCPVPAFIRSPLAYLFPEPPLSFLFSYKSPPAPVQRLTVRIATFKIRRPPLVPSVPCPSSPRRTTSSLSGCIPANAETSATAATCGGALPPSPACPRR